MIETERATLDVNGQTIKLHKVVGQSAKDVVAEMKRLALDDHPRSRLPGPNPVSLERSDMPKLKTGYVIAEKTDGTRFMMCCLRLYDVKLCVIVDRAMTVYLLPLQHIPRVLFQGSILDGEITATKQGAATFVLFDAVVVSGITVSQLNFSDRLTAMHRSMRAFRPHPHDPVSLSFKKWVPTNAPDLSERLAKAEAVYHCDGVILMPIADPVIYGRHMNMYKLKPRGTHTVDFVLLAVNGTVGVYDPASQKNVEVGKVFMKNNQLYLIGTILECEYHEGRWLVLHWRSDKNQANDMLTYTKTMRNIAEDIKIEELLSIM
jgi:hypothetical protein